MSHDFVIFGSGEAPEETVAAGEHRLQETGVDVDPAREVFPEDVPDAVLRATFSPAWQIEIHAPRTRSGVAAAREIAERLAGSGSAAVVYDPQKDRVVWPRGGHRMFNERGAGPGGEPPSKVDVLEVEWCFARRLGPGDAERFVSILASRLPEGMPRRFGTTEPLEYRLDRDGVGRFLAQWADEEDLLFWKAEKLPVFGGSASGPSSAGPSSEDPHTRRGTSKIGLEMDAGVLDSEAWYGALRGLLVAVAVDLGAFYAAAFVSRGWIVRRGSLWADGYTEKKAICGRFWPGLPDFDTTITYLGPEYSVCLTAAGEMNSADIPGGGRLLEGGSRDMIRREYVRRGGHLDEVLAAEVIPGLW